jgi:hypothetical protein
MIKNFDHEISVFHGKGHGRAHFCGVVMDAQFIHQNPILAH